MEYIFQDISKQMMETNCTLRLDDALPTPQRAQM